MAQAGVVWQQSPQQMAQRVKAYGVRLVAAVYALAQAWASRLAAQMKATHPWQNQTGAAEAGLFGRAMRLAAGAVIICGHGVPYGVYLERKYAGRFAVILPVMQRAYAAIMASVQALVR